MKPAAVDPALEPEAVAPGSLLRLGPNDETRRILRGYVRHRSATSGPRRPALSHRLEFDPARFGDPLGGIQDLQRD